MPKQKCKGCFWYGEIKTEYHVRYGCTFKPVCKHCDRQWEKHCSISEGPEDMCKEWTIKPGIAPCLDKLPIHYVLGLTKE